MQNIDFKFDIDFYGDSIVTFDVDGKHYEFQPSYMGENPLNLLIKGLYCLETACYKFGEDVSSHRMLWQGEPEGQTVKLTKKGDELYVAVSHFSDIEYYDRNSFAFCDLTLVFEAHTNYDDFKSKVCREAIRMLHKFGIVGYVDSWGNDGEEFPLSKLLYLLGNTTTKDNECLYYSDLSDELSLLSLKK